MTHIVLPTWIPEEGPNCGTGAGGFKMGNTCAAEDGVSSQSKGKRRGPKDFSEDEISTLAGKSGGLRAEVERKIGGNGYDVTIRGPGVRYCERSIRFEDDGSIVIVNKGLETAGGQGIGGKLFATQVEAAYRTGVSRIATYASRQDGPGGYIGYKVWPKFGYDAPLDGYDLPESLAGAETVLDLYETSEGQAWWEENGDSIDMSFDLSPGSRSMEIFNAYQRKKGRPVVESCEGCECDGSCEGDGVEEPDFTDGDYDAIDSVWSERRSGMSITTEEYRFTEEAFCNPDHLKVDRENKVIRGVKIISRESKNGRTYANEALEQARQLYEGSDVCVDHPREDDQHVARSMRDSFGILNNCRVLQDGVYGDLHYIESHPDSAPIVERAERFPRSFGLSHNAVGNVTPGKAGQPDMVESISYVESVDVVRKPATTRGLFEQVDPKKERRMTVPVKKKLKSILAEAKGNKEAARLQSLLEGDLRRFAEMTVEAPPESDAVQAGVDAMVLAVTHNDKLSPKEKASTINKILNVEEDMSDGKPKPGDKPPVDGTNKAMEAIMARLEASDRRNLERDLLEEYGFERRSLSESQRTLLSRQPDEDTMRALIESWPEPESAPREYVTRESKQGPKPPVGAKLRESSGGNEQMTLEQWSQRLAKRRA